MKKFFAKYSYDSAKLLIDQAAVGLFGAVLSIVSSMAKSGILKYTTCAIAIAFFLFLQYTVMWRLGAKDEISISIGKMKFDPLLPLKMWALANVPNFIIAICISLASWFDVKFLSLLGQGSAIVTMFLNGMYMGILSAHVGGAPLNSYWFMHFVITLPSLLVVYLAYILGVKNVHFTNMLVDDLPKSDRDEKKKRK